MSPGNNIRHPDHTTCVKTLFTAVIYFLFGSTGSLLACDPNPMWTLPFHKSWLIKRSHGPWPMDGFQPHCLLWEKTNRQCKKMFYPLYRRSCQQKPWALLCVCCASHILILMRPTQFIQFHLHFKQFTTYLALQHDLDFSKSSLMFHGYVYLSVNVWMRKILSQIN